MKKLYKYKMTIKAMIELKNGYLTTYPDGFKTHPEQEFYGELPAPKTTKYTTDFIDVLSDIGLSIWDESPISCKGGKIIKIHDKQFCIDDIASITILSAPRLQD